MSKKKSPRKKTYHKKVVRLPSMAAAFLPEYTEAQKTNLGLAQLLPVKALRTSEASKTNIIAAVTTVKLGVNICEHYDDTGDLKDACILAMAALVAGLDYTERHEALPDYLVDPIEYAVNRIVEIEMLLDRPALMHTFSESTQMDAHCLLVEEALIGAIIPDVPEVARYAGLKGYAFAGGHPYQGRLSDSAPWAWISSDGESIPINKPILAYLDEQKNGGT